MARSKIVDSGILNDDASEPNHCITTHQLDFFSCEHPNSTPEFVYQYYKIGTCSGQWGSLHDSYFILSIVNSAKGNGHLDDVFEWFEHSCKRDGKNLLVLECLSDRFFNHLINKRGFVQLGNNDENAIKVFNQKLYKKLLKKGNEILQPKTFNCI